MLIIVDMSFKNNVTISVIWREQEIITKLVHHAFNVNFIKAKLFAIRCRINHAMQLQDISLQYQKTSKVFSIRVLTIPLSFWIVLTPLSCYSMCCSNHSPEQHL